MKKQILFALLAAFVVAATTACGSSDSGKADSTAAATTGTTISGDISAANDEGAAAVLETLVFPETLNNGEPCELSFAWWGSQTRHERTQQVVDLFMQKYPNVKINTEQYDFNGYFQKMATLVGAGDVWDVFQLGNGFAEYEGVLTDLQPYIDKGIINTDYIDDAMLDITNFNGKQVAMSLGTAARCILYNADLFSEAGIAEPEDNWTWEEFEQTARALKEVTGEFGISSLDAYYLSCISGVPQAQDGLNFFKADNSGMELEDPTVLVPFIEMMNRLTQDGIYPDAGALNEIGGNTEQSFVVTGEAGLHWINSNQVVSVADAASKNGYNNIKLATIPRVEKDGTSGIKAYSSQGVSISPSCEYPDVAAAFINFLINSNGANQILLGERGVPISSDVRASLMEYLDPSEQMAYDYIDKVAAFGDADKININEPAPFVVIQDNFNIELQKYINGDQDALTTAENVLKLANSTFSR